MFVDFAKRTTGVAHCHGVVGDILRHHAARADDCVPANGYAGQDMEREIPIFELQKVADDIWDKSPEQQDLIREQKAKEFEAKYPIKQGRIQQK